MRFSWSDARNAAVIAAAVAIPLALGVLCCARGGVDSAVSSAVFAAVLALSAASFLADRWMRLGLRAPWTLVALLLWPIAQLAPLGACREWLWPAWRLEWSRTVAALGVEPGSAISFYPHATLRASIVLAGCGALFVLTRAVARRGGRAVVFMAAVILAIATAEAALGLWQVSSAAGAAHGTFVNRNHFAVLLEVGFCLALGLSGLARDGLARAPAVSVARLVLLRASLAAGAVCLAGIAVSQSRMGFTLVVFAVPLGTLLLSRLRSVVLPALLLAGLALAGMLSFSGSNRFEQLGKKDGDPGRRAIWADSVRAVQRNWLTGSGLGAFTYAFQRGELYFPRNTVDHAHNDWIEFVVELGLPAGLLLIGTIGFVVARAAIRREHPIAAAATLAAAVMILHALVKFLRLPRCWRSCWAPPQGNRFSGLRGGDSYSHLRPRGVWCSLSSPSVDLL